MSKLRSKVTGVKERTFSVWKSKLSQRLPESPSIVSEGQSGFLKGQQMQQEVLGISDGSCHGLVT